MSGIAGCVGFTTAAQPIAGKRARTLIVVCRSIHAPIVGWRNAPTVMQGSWSAAISSHAADEPVGVSLLAIWREAAVKPAHGVGQTKPRSIALGLLRNPSSASRTPTPFAQKRTSYATPPLILPGTGIRRAVNRF